MKKKLGQVQARIIAAVLLVGLMPANFGVANVKAETPDSTEEYEGGYISKPWEENVPVADDSLTVEQVDELIKGESDDETDGLPHNNKAIYVPGGNPESAYPAKYDNREKLSEYLETYAPPTRNQNPYGTCWAHASIALAELYAIKQQGADRNSVDYSERHLVRYTYGYGEPHMISDAESGDTIMIEGGVANSNDITDDEEITILSHGGNYSDAAQALMRWKGIASENTVKYPINKVETEKPVSPHVNWNRDIAYSNEQRLENFYEINIKENPDIAKRYIKEYGGVGVVFKAEQPTLGFLGSYYNFMNNSYYNVDEVGGPHAVVIVGWDDDFPKSKFSKTAEKNGAWLIRNSWFAYDKANFAYNSYFWMSYCDPSLSESAYVYKLQDKSEWKDNNYYYNTQFSSPDGYSKPGYKAANVFVAKGASDKELLESVSFQALRYSVPSEGAGYTVEIYRGLKGADPDSGNLVSQQQGTIPFKGMYTIELDKPVVLDKGERYSVIVALDEGTVDCEPFSTAEFEIGNDIIQYTAKCGAKGQSFMSSGRKWQDNTTNCVGNWCIGAQTVDLPSLTAAAGSNYTSVDLSWNAVKGVSGYELRRSKTHDGTYTKIASLNVSATSYTDSNVTKDETYYYKLYRVVAGKADVKSCPEPTEVYLGDTSSIDLTADDFTIDRSHLDKNSLYNASEQYVTATGPDDYKGDVSIYYQMIYDGSGFTVETTATTDKPINAGTYKVIVKAGAYKKYKKAELTKEDWNVVINPIDLSKGTLNTTTDNVYYNGSAHKASEWAISCNGIMMTPGVDYSCNSYNRNSNGEKTLTYSGKFQAIVQATGDNYIGKGKVELEIKPVTITVIPTDNQSKDKYADDPESFKYTLDTSKVISGETCSITGKLGRSSGENLGKHPYNLGTLELKDNGEFKKINYILKLETGHYFKIEGSVVRLNSDNVILSTLEYNGKSQEPEISVIYNGITLIENVDYQIIMVPSLKDVGATGFVTIEGKGDYEGTVYKKFTVEKGTPTYTVPGPYTLEYDQTLKDISLPEGFSFEDEDTVLTVGADNDVKVKYTPEDTDKYKEVTGIKIIVTVNPDASTVPTETPTPDPTEMPTPDPTEMPTPDPTETPTPEPTEAPTPDPTETPTPEPTETPTPALTETPTPVATVTPISKPVVTDVDITKEIPYAENISVAEKETVIKTADTDKKDVEGSAHRYLMLKVKPKKTSITISWKKIAGADGYIIYGAKCGTKMQLVKKIENPSETKYTVNKLKKGTYYKYVVVSYKNTEAGEKVITTSKSVHVTTDGGKKGNPTAIKLKKSKFKLKVGKTAKIKASFKKKKKVSIHIAKFRYESTDTNVATVTENGTVKAVGKGKCKIYVYTQNGICKTVTVTVK